jgi:hypothetical protein
MHGPSAYDPYPKIREKIEEGRNKFKEFKDFPCSLVLKNGNAFVHLDSPDIVLGAMYGDSGFSFPVDTRVGRAAGPLKPAFLGWGKMVRGRRTQNTTISAFITLRHVAVGMSEGSRSPTKYKGRSCLDTRDEFGSQTFQWRRVRRPEARLGQMLEQLGFVDQAVVNCIERQFESVGDTEFIKNVVEMILHGLLADEESYADFLVAKALGDELDDLLFTVADDRLCATRFGAGCREGVDHLGGDAVIKPNFTSVHAMYAF